MDNSTSFRNNESMDLSVGYNHANDDDDIEGRDKPKVSYICGGNFAEFINSAKILEPLEKIKEGVPLNDAIDHAIYNLSWNINKNKIIYSIFSPLFFFTVSSFLLRLLVVS